MTQPAENHQEETHEETPHVLVGHGDSVEHGMVNSQLLLLLGLAVLAICLFRTPDHHHQAGAGALALFGSAIASVAWLIWRTKKRGELYDQTERASRNWLLLRLGGPIAVMIVSCRAGLPGGLGITFASTAFFVIVVLEIHYARGQAVSKSFENEEQDEAGAE
ncbi:MAG TPA: hypothetical protein VHD84_00645 [Candidatus Saccharimonadales bacterium]|nr:hypothetical protein [Candidatus Saccharimonadales bacterium]